MQPFGKALDSDEGQIGEAALCSLPAGIAGVKEAGQRTCCVTAAIRL